MKKIDISLSGNHTNTFSYVIEGEGEFAQSVWRAPPICEHHNIAKI